jgi:hypothetical protein
MEEPPLIEFAWYGSIGARALKRQNNGSLGSAYQGDGDVLGAADFARLPEVQNFNQLSPAMGWGPTVTFGFIENNHMLEFYGFPIPIKEGYPVHLVVHLPHPMHRLVFRVFG